MLATNIENAVPTGITHESAVPTGTINQGDPMGSIQFVEAGVYEDPRVTIKGKVIEVFDAITNVHGKAQRSIRIQQDDNTTVLVSGFGSKTAKLEGLHLGYTYSFKGKLKTKMTTYQGKEKESTFLNL